MKLLSLVVLSLSSVLFLVPLLFVESSSISDNITRGSSLSTSSCNDTRSYWLSPSGNIAFGFYLLPCKRCPPKCSDRYVVGIWFVKSAQKTLVWSANRNDLTLHQPSSILFTDEGRFVLRNIPNNKDKLLLSDVPEPASYAKMHDDGNFVLYGSESQIVWESFDYPTDTILGGQKLKPGVNLISGIHMLSVSQRDGLVAVYTMDSSYRGYRAEEILKVVSNEIGDSVNTPLTLKLDTSGNLYLVDSDDVVLKYLYRNKNQQRKQQEEGFIMKEEGYIYRATLDLNESSDHSEWFFNLYKERIDGIICSTDHNEKSSSSLVRLWPTYELTILEVFAVVLIFSIEIFCLTLIVKKLWKKLWRDYRRKKAEKEGTGGGDLELEKTEAVI